MPEYPQLWLDTNGLPSRLGDFVVIAAMVKNVMLNLFQHLLESITYQTLKRVQGDKKGITTQPLGGGGWGECNRINSTISDQEEGLP